MLQFKQELFLTFLKPYIERNTDLQSEAEQEGDKIKKKIC